MTHYDQDVIVAGAGIAGLTLAASLAQSGLSVLLLEASPRPSSPTLGTDIDQWDRRVSALTPASVGLLRRVGAWAHIDPKRIAPYQSMQVWDAEGTGTIDFEAAEVGVTDLGHIVENRITVDALLAVVERSSRVRIDWGDGVEGLARDRDCITVTTQGEAQWSAPLLVAADGARSRLRDMAGFKTRSWSYHQGAIVATVALEHSHDGTCFQAFSATGPVALLPLADPCLCSIVWSVDDPQWERLMALDSDGFIKALNAALAGNAPAVCAIGERAVFPLHQSHAVDYVTDRLALVADAAHSIHPLAGQGINLGLADVGVLANVVTTAYHDDLDWGKANLLRRYQRRRKTDNLAMMAAMEAFKRGFGNRHPLALAARNVGLNWVNQTPLLKRWFAAQALAAEGL